MANVANGEFAAICVDQLDAIADEIDGVGGGSPLLHELVNQVSEMQNIELILTCRSFDLSEGPGLNWLTDSNSSVTQTFEVLELRREDVVAALVSAEIDHAELSEPQIEMLRVPLHLYLFIEAAQSRAMAFATIDDLFDAYWREKRARVIDRPSIDSSGWFIPISKLCRLFSDVEAQSARAIT